jgi:hypothetical protein
MNKSHCTLASCGLAVVPASQQLFAADTALRRSVIQCVIQFTGDSGLALNQHSLHQLSGLNHLKLFKKDLVKVITLILT